MFFFSMFSKENGREGEGGERATSLDGRSGSNESQGKIDGLVLQKGFPYVQRAKKRDSGWASTQRGRWGFVFVEGEDGVGGGWGKSAYGKDERERERQTYGDG